MSVPTLTMNDGRTIPQLGLGVFKVSPAETARVVRDALAVGYRHVDTAQMYANERGVGEAVRDSGIAREELFLTSKLNNGFHRPDDARRAFDQTLADLGTDYVDLFLIHWPLPTRYDGDFVSTWRTMIEFQRDGRARSIGVSNFQVDHLRRLAEETDVVPAVNQVEAHPYFQNQAVREADQAAGILTEAWAPIARGRVVEDPLIAKAADEVQRTPAQVTLRWHLQRGDVVFPKTTRAERMRENFAVFDFELDEAQMQAITDLDEGPTARTGPDPDTFDYVG